MLIEDIYRYNYRNKRQDVKRAYTKIKRKKWVAVGVLMNGEDVMLGRALRVLAEGEKGVTRSRIAKAAGERFQ